MIKGKDAKELAVELFNYAVDAVRPHALIKNNVYRNGDNLSICGQAFDLSQVKNLYVVGAGKATALMASEVEEILLDKITKGIIIVKYEHSAPLKKIICKEAGHPLPDERGIMATEEILNLVSSADKNDLVICLISGGGSSLLCDYPEGVKLEDIISLSNFLLKSGANIQEMNAVRKHLSKVKGGNLAKSVFPARLVTLILSDVIGDPLDVIASGPTVPDPTTYNDAITVLKKYHIYDKVDTSIIKYLEKGEDGKHSETPKKGDSIFNNTHNFIIGSNMIALKAAQDKALAYGINTKIISATVEGEAKKVAEELVNNAKKMLDQNTDLPVCLLYGGETTVTIRGEGLGGRNQELALAAAIQLKNSEKIILLSGGTDGNDGPTNAAGAVVDGSTYINAVNKRVQPEDYLNNNDSFHFFEKTSGHIKPGPTLTNVMDLMIVIVEQ